MIAFLRGRLAARYPDHVVIDVSGVGYRVFVSLTTASALGEVGADVTVHVHTLVREDVLQLFGFDTEEERTAFRALIKVKDIGPKVARTILGVPADELARAVAMGDIAWLQRIPGVGKRIAERLSVELKDKLGGPGAQALPQVTAPGGTPLGGTLRDLSDALLALGYRPAAIQTVLRKLHKEAEAGASLEVLIKRALQVVR